MDSSDEDEADIDKDDDVEDCDYKPGKFEESPSEDDYDDDDCISDEESLDSIKNDVLTKSRRHLLFFTCLSKSIGVIFTIFFIDRTY